MADQNIYVIIDGSGSMGGIKHDVVTGINEFIKEQKDDVAKTGDNVKFSLTSFDNKVMEVYTAEDIALVNPVTLQDTFLGGGTALLDAIGKTLSLAESVVADRNLVVIYTDGHENASHEFTNEDIGKLIEKLEATGKWQIIYLGAEFGDFASDAAYGTLSMSSGGRMSTVNTSKKNVTGTISTASATAAYYRNASDAAVQDFAGEEDGLIVAAAAAGIDWEATKDEEDKK